MLWLTPLFISIKQKLWLLIKLIPLAWYLPTQHLQWLLWQASLRGTTEVGWKASMLFILAWGGIQAAIQVSWDSVICFIGLGNSGTFDENIYALLLYSYLLYLLRQFITVCLFWYLHVTCFKISNVSWYVRRNTVKFMIKEKMQWNTVS